MSSDQLSVTFAALADPTRRAILAHLTKGEASVSELAQPFEMSLPAISKHLKVLERAGLITRGREAQWRPCQLKAESLKDVADWLEDYRGFWEQNLDRLEDYRQESRDISVTVSDRPLAVSLHRHGKRPPSGADVDAEHR